jgi:ubiquinone/menaquinone biosynthesis C-methylase UbiE
MDRKPEISHVTRTKEQARANYNRLSHWYEWLSGSSEQPFIDMGLQEIGQCEGNKILEIGCGTGQALSPLSIMAGENGQVYGIDLSEGMLRNAYQNVMQKHAMHNTFLLQADGQQIPIECNSFDLVFMSFVLELFDTAEIPLVLSECRRALKRDGQLIIVAMVRDIVETWPVKIYEWFHEVMPVSVDCRPIYLQESLSAAGFGIIKTIRRKMWGLPVEICVSRK